MAVREAFQSTSRRGLNLASPPMRLWQKAKKLGVWDPADIDLTQDRRDWQRITAPERDLLLRLTSQFQAGEEAVTLDLLPLIGVVAAEGRLEEEVYLTSFLWEEAKHVETFRRFLDEVACCKTDLSEYHGPCYRQLFYDELPAALGQLRHDASPLAQAHASVTYNLIVEGVLAETGYHTYYQTLRVNGLMPGMQKAIDLLKRDESRHLAYGVFLLSRLVAVHGDPIWEAIRERMQHLVQLAMGLINETFAAYQVMPFGLKVEDFLQFAMGQFEQRMTRVEKARRQTLEEVMRGEGFETASV
jgi:ribonucleoside-diphosphate reductase beta chain